eukprot:TRINITY_DN7818_c0_g1_i1.p1 TRINITY_DN7818_c0_g1~~TRINITY_DN7818_c0_g1_i1.p1  ORF type:complete len:160 (+),score=25.59 TRINITY_DN7818_c0_g1_i1:297-776(+)
MKTNNTITLSDQINCYYTGQANYVPSTNTFFCMQYNDQNNNSLSANTYTVNPLGFTNNMTSSFGKDEAFVFTTINAETNVAYIVTNSYSNSMQDTLYQLDLNKMEIINKNIVPSTTNYTVDSVNMMIPTQTGGILALTTILQPVSQESNSPTQILLISV